MSDIDFKKWLEAMKYEMNSMSSNEDWTLVDPPKGVRTVGCRWFYKRKLGADHEVTAFKTRLVGKGYTKRPGVDFEETYSPVGIAKSIGRLLAIIACRRVSLPLDKNRKFFVSRGPSMASNKLPEAGTHILMKSFGVMISSRMSMILVHTRKSMGARLHIRHHREAHSSAVKTILKYLKRTKDIFLIYGGGELILEGYSDASFQSDDDDAKSQSGFVFKLNGGVVA
ncbi:hypothetical protein Sango_2693100 [Sesamum angolense]|uniref:Reverse transcriptase Ty1/copia-type domain-containing protein n=1 Tax=Sesamum angolense TaxID=2727404 RepID=A0AAE1W2T9_9LAMI|nr:hypothetical protein Sango_2693100 [Sesamum angolense]